jgi:hypothetical protein
MASPLESESIEVPPWAKVSRSRVSLALRALAPVCSLAIAAALGGCSSGDGGGAVADAGSREDRAANDGPVTPLELGPCPAGLGTVIPDAVQTTRCVSADGGRVVQPIDANACQFPSDAGRSSYAPPNYGAEADEDDCKFHVRLETRCVVGRDHAVVFQATCTNADGSAVTGANPLPEVYLADQDLHFASDATSSTQESPPESGIYSVGPITLDVAGLWVVRLHFFDDCLDGKDSPHSHVSFYLNAP